MYDLPWAPGQGAQEYVLDQIFSGLENDIHFFVIGKARQLGITTLMLLLDIFWNAMYPGLQGAMVFDEEPNKEKIRLLLEEIIDGLPSSHPLPISRHRSKGLVVDHGALGRSMLDYLTAGTKKKTGSLGRSRAFNFLHGDEVAMWGDEDAIESLLSSLSDVYPARLYVLMSTGRGYNHFHRMYKDAEADDLTQRAIFVAWWRHPGYVFEEGTALFNRYGYQELSRDEEETQKIVKELYDYTITREQWAWYRHRKDPRRRRGLEEVDEEKAQIVEVEYPSYPDEMFRLTGSPFLPGMALDTALQRATKQMFKGYYYRFGSSFTDIDRRQVGTSRTAQLKVWDEPRPNGIYIIGGDPAGASSEDSDRHCAQVMRAYADRLVQCAEFCVTNIEAYQFTWVLADLCGWYKNARFVLDINGIGEAVMGEFRHLQTLLDTGRLVVSRYEEEQQEERRIPSPLANVRNYLYHRPDAFGSGYNLHFKTTPNNKEPLMVSFGDQFLMGKLIVNSVQCLGEMKTLSRNGAMIKAEGKAKDDRPMGLALANRYWVDWIRSEMDGEGRTFEREEQRDAATGDGDEGGYMSYIMQMRAAENAARRRGGGRLARRPNWNW